MRTTWRRLACLLVWSLASCQSGGTDPTYPAPPTGAALGVSWSQAGGAASFRVWAPAASTVSVRFFDRFDSSAAGASYPMLKELGGGGSDLDKEGWNGVWTATVQGVTRGQLYQYAVDGTPALDPYAPSMGRFDSGPNGSAWKVGMGAVLDATALRPLALSGTAEEDWAPFTAPPGYAKREDAVIYEAHVRDFTILVGAGLANPRGTYRAMAERLAHVRDLGATHLQLLPVLAAYWGDEGARATPESVRSTSGNNYNWGYDPQSYFSPEGMYSADPADPALRVQELKTLVNEAHKLGLGVMLDVVYNHTVDRQVLDPLAPGYYYRGTSASGAGPDVATERKMARKLVVDSIRHWVSAYHVDGFRFDLMGLMDSKTVLDAYAAASALNPSVLFVGEGWRMGGPTGTDGEGNPIQPANQDWMGLTDVAAVFSDSFRDVVKGGGLNEGSDADAHFVTGGAVDGAALFRNLTGDATNNQTDDDPGDSVQYLTAHDGLTLHDKIGKILRLPDSTARGTILRVARLAFALQATAQGIAFVHAGCEFGRTKWMPAGPQPPESTPSNGDPGYYVFNSYDASDAVNGLDWALLAPGSEGAGLRDYVRGLFALRRSSDAFRLGTRALATARVTLLDGSKPQAIAYRAVDSAGTTAFSVFVNAGTSAATLATGGDLTGAAVVVDARRAGTSPLAAPEGLAALTAASVTVAPRTAVVFRAGP